MPIHPFGPIRGRIESFTIESQALADNMLGDPSTREVHVYLPPNYEPSTGVPLMVDLVGFTGSGRAHLNWKPFAESVPQRHERLVKEEKILILAIESGSIKDISRAIKDVLKSCILTKGVKIDD